MLKWAKLTGFTGSVSHRWLGIEHIRQAILATGTRLTLNSSSPTVAVRDSNTRTQGEDYGVEPNSRAILISNVTRIGSSTK